MPLGTAGPNQAFVINFADGMIHNDKICNDKDTSSFFVWPVRGGLDP